MSPSFVESVFKHSRYIVIGIVCITILFAIRTAATPINGDMLHAFVDDEQVVATHLEQSRRFGDDSGKMVIVVADEGEQLFSASKLNAIRAAKNEILEIDEVQAITCFVDAYQAHDRRQKQNIKTVLRESLARTQLLDGLVPEVEFKPKRYWETTASKQARTNLRRLRADALADDRLVGTLLSADGTKHSLMIAIDPDVELSIPRQQSLEKQFRAVLVKHKVGENAIHIAGLPIVNAAVGQQIQNAFIRLLPIGFLVIAIFVYLVYWDFRVTGLIVLIGIIAVVWALGITSFVFGEITILVAAAPLVILAVSTTDFLHITTAYQIALSRNDSEQKKALSQVLVEVGGACVLTSLTTFVGFASLVLTHSVAVRQFGFACAVGASIALLLMITLLPIALNRLKPLASLINESTVYWLIDKLIGYCDFVTQRFPKIIIGAVVAVCIPGIWLIAGKPIDADVPGQFPEGHPVRRGLRVLEEEFSGINSIDIFVSGKPGALLEPAASKLLQQFVDRLKSEPEVLNTISVLDVYQGINDSISFQTTDGLPPSQQAADASLKWVAKIEPALVDSLVTRQRDEIRVRVMVRSAGFRSTNRLATRLGNELQETLGSDLNVQSGGTYSIIGDVVTDIVRSQIVGFIICAVSLTLILIWGLGSWRVGLLAQFPNFVPVLLMVSVAAFCLNRIDSDLLGLPMIALGIAVDDTIHFLTRLRLERSRSQDKESALRSVFKTTGRSIVISTLALCLGLFPLAFAQIISLWMIGTFLVVGILGALVADLLCLPAMIRLGILDYEQTV